MPIFAANSARRRIIFRALVSGFVCLALFLVFAITIQLFSPQTRVPFSTTEAEERHLYYHSPANNHKIALTFDDGPDQDTYANMAALLRHDVPATFFFIGTKSLMNPGIVRDVVANSFLIGNHSFSHSFNVHNSEQRLLLELRFTSLILNRIADVQATYYRPPYLLAIGVDPGLNPFIPRQQPNLWALNFGYHPVGIDIDSMDWEARDPEEIVAGFKESLAKDHGHIALFHDVPYTAEALEEIIPWLKGQGYRIVPLSELLEPPTAFALSEDLAFGDTNETTAGAVSVLQWFLYKQGVFDPFALSGVYDEATREAVAAYEEQVGLLPSGSEPGAAVGAELRAHIAEISTAPTPAPAPAPGKVAALLDRAEKGFLYAFSFADELMIFLAGIALSFMLMRTLVLGLLLLFGRFKKPHASNVPASYQPLVTVLIPAYNEAENIRATIESVLKNTYPNREIIVIDDGSTDNTSVLVEGLQAASPENISLIKTENGGKARALTIGLGQAKGELLVVVDADAVLDRHAVAHLVPHFYDKRVGAVAGKVETARERTLLSYFQSLEYAVGQNIDKRAFSVLGAVGVVPGPAGAWRTELVQNVGGFPGNTLVEDQDLTLMALRAGYKVMYEPRAITVTETPHTVANFLKQRFRWVYGTVQCFWKHRRMMIEQPLSPASWIVMPNIFLFGIIMPLIYPVIDTALILMLFFRVSAELWFAIIVFTCFDILYVLWGLQGERDRKKLIWLVPLQRVFYRQLLYYTVLKSVVRAIEGRGALWNKFAKLGSTDQYYYTTLSPTSARNT